MRQFMSADVFISRVERTSEFSDAIIKSERCRALIVALQNIGEDKTMKPVTRKNTAKLVYAQIKGTLKQEAKTLHITCACARKRIQRFKKIYSADYRQILKCHKMSHFSN